MNRENNGNILLLQKNNPGEGESGPLEGKGFACNEAIVDGVEVSCSGLLNRGGVTVLCVF